MPKFPEPPAPGELAAVTPVPRRLPRGTELWRVYFQGGAHPTGWSAFRTFGPTSGRFDPHLPPPRDQERRVLYAAVDGLTCLAEVFQDTRVIDRRRALATLVGFRLQREVTLLDLTGTWPSRAGASMAINTGPRPRARRWSRVIRDAYPDIEGVYYPSSMYAHRPCVALWGPAESALPPHPTVHRLLSDPVMTTMLKNAAEDLGYDLL